MVTTFLYLLPFRGKRYLFGAKWVNRLNQFFIINKLKKQLNKLGFINPLLFISAAHALPLLKEFEKSIKKQNRMKLIVYLNCYFFLNYKEIIKLK